MQQNRMIAARAILSALVLTIGPTRGSAQGIARVAVADTVVLTLHEAGRRALEQEPGLQAERVSALIARGEFRQARLDGLNPTVDLQRYEAGVVGGTQAYTLGVSADVPWAGQRGLRVAAARAGVERADAWTANAERLAEAYTALAFFAAIAAERRLVFAEQMVMASQRFFDVTRIQLREGEISALEANLTEIELGRSRGRLLGARRDAVATMLELRRLIGVSPSTPLRLVDPEWPLPARSPANEDSLIEMALARRPDLEASRRQIAQAETLRRLAGRDAIPTPRLSAFSQRDAGERSSRLGLGVSVMLPVIDRGQGRIDQEKARLAQAQSRYAALELSVRLQVAEAYRSAQSAGEEVEALQSMVLEPARRNLALLDAAYQAGKLALPTVLLVRNQLLDAELDFWRAWQSQREAVVRLYLAAAAPITTPSASRSPSPKENQ